MIVPDVVGPIIGYRAWRIVDDSWDVHLQSIHAPDVRWPPGEWLHAVCPKTRLEDDVPHEGMSEAHRCGIYAARHRVHLVALTYNEAVSPHDLRCIGEVELAGKVIPGTQGWRAGRARPARLWVPHEHWRIARRLADTYGIPVALTNPYKPKETVR